jgi:hypothetical protein
MPRPTPAQFAYGSVTVIVSTLAMLLLSRTPSGPGVAVIATVALVLGVLVAIAVPGTSSTDRARTGAVRAESSSTRSAAAPSLVRARRDAAGTRTTAVRAARSSAHRMAEPSLRP